MTYINPVNEEAYENSIIELFQELGYTHVYGPDVEDRDFTSPLYEPVLTNALHQINPNLPDEAINEALFNIPTTSTRKEYYVWRITNKLQEMRFGGLDKPRLTNTLSITT